MAFPAEACHGLSSPAFPPSSALQFRRRAANTHAANTNWPANSRIYVTGTLTVNAGVTLTFGEGTIVKIYTGTATNGTAAEIVVNGTLQVNGVDGNPVVFAPDAAGGYWGGIELPVATSNVTATQAIFTGSGEDETWFNTHSGYSTHRPNQALFLLAGSGSGTAVGAQLHLTNCYCFSLAGQEMNSKTSTWVDLQRTLMQRAVTCGELNGSKVTIDRSALVEFPSEDATFVDADNDAIYLTNGELSLTNNVIGFTKDDGVDSGGNGGDNPCTAAADVTPYLSQNNWFEGTCHEGNSLSGTRNVSFIGCVFFNVGQGVERGYSASANGDGPNATVDGCLFVSNMVGVRRGDNYGPGYSYNGAMEVKNFLVLNSLYKDAYSGQWNVTAAFSPAVTFGTAPGYGGNTADKTKAYYFRKKSTVTDPAQVATLTFNVRRDDGVVAWLNNDASPTVVSADGAWTAPYTYANPAPSATNTGTCISYPIPTSKLVAGQNILAVEVHQTTIGSSDLLLDCELVATCVAPLQLSLGVVGSQPVLYWFDSAAALETTTDLSGWFPVVGGLSPVPFSAGVPKMFFRLRK